jgi:general stress protein 26
VIKEIQKYQDMVLATSEGESVTARTVACISDGLTVYFTTTPGSRKYSQIAANPNVALAAGNLQIEGIASVKGHPLAEGNAAFIEVLRETRPELYEGMSQMHFKIPNYQLIEVAPRRIALYRMSLRDSVVIDNVNYEGYMLNVPQVCIDILNTSNEEAHRV